MYQVFKNLRVPCYALHFSEMPCFSNAMLLNWSLFQLSVNETHLDGTCRTMQGSGKVFFSCVLSVSGTLICTWGTVLKVLRPKVLSHHGQWPSVNGALCSSAGKHLLTQSPAKLLNDSCQVWGTVKTNITQLFVIIRFTNTNSLGVMCTFIKNNACLVIFWLYFGFYGSFLEMILWWLSHHLFCKQRVETYRSISPQLCSALLLKQWTVL